MVVAVPAEALVVELVQQPGSADVVREIVALLVELIIDLLGGHHCEAGHGRQPAPQHRQGRPGRGSRQGPGPRLLLAAKPVDGEDDQAQGRFYNPPEELVPQQRPYVAQVQVVCDQVPTAVEAVVEIRRRPEQKQSGRHKVSFHPFPLHPHPSSLYPALMTVLMQAP